MSLRVHCSVFTPSKASVATVIPPPAKLTVVRLLQLEKALFPIALTLNMITVMSEVQS